MSKKSEMSSTISESDIAAEARRCVMIAAGERQWSDTREVWLARAAHFLGITPRRAKSLFYREARNITASEFLTLRHRAAEIERRIQAREAARAERRQARGGRAAAGGGMVPGPGVEPPGLGIDQTG